MDLECIKTLISLDADVNIETAKGITPLDLANINSEIALRSHDQGIELTDLEHGAVGPTGEGVMQVET